MPECCGRECGTPYCPLCGKRLKRGDVASLIAHMHRTLGRYKKELVTLEEYLTEARQGSDMDWQSRLDGKIKQAKDNVRRWEAWLAWVEAKAAQE